MGSRHVVWCEFQNERGEWRAPCLLLSTDVTLSPETIIESYSLRWPIESMFHQLKQAWGLKDAWQQTRQMLHRWVHITMVSYGLVQMLSCLQSDVVNALCQHSPWRHESPVTAGQLRKGLTIIFRHVAVRQWWDGKRKKFRPPGRAELTDFDSQQEKAA